MDGAKFNSFRGNQLLLIFIMNKTILEYFIRLKSNNSSSIKELINQELALAISDRDQDTINVLLAIQDLMIELI